MQPVYFSSLQIVQLPPGITSIMIPLGQPGQTQG